MKIDALTADLFGDDDPFAASSPAADFNAAHHNALLALGRALQDDGYQFVTSTPATHQRVNARPGNEWAETMIDVLGWSRPFREGVVTERLMALMREAGMLTPHANGWRSTLRASTLGNQLFFHSAYPTAATDAVFFGPDTYRFVRALNAELAALGPVRRAVDIGCGAGPGAISIARMHPQAAVLAVDINDAALRMTALNAALADTTNVIPQNSNLLTAVEGNFDLIVANPPYLLDRDQRAYRHGGGELGSGLSLAIVDAASQRLAPGGTLLLYTGVAIVNGNDPFLQEVALRLDNADLAWQYEEIDPDVFGEELDEAAYACTDRIAAVWLKARKSLQT